MRFFDRIKELAPLGLTDMQVSDDLNEFEIRLFDTLPWALELPEEQQNGLIVYCYKLRSVCH